MIIPRCCWCGSRFKYGMVEKAAVYYCPSAACFLRCRSRAISVNIPNPDRKSGMEQPRVVYFPLPKQVEVMEAVESGRYMRILTGGARGGSKSHGIRWLHYAMALKYPGLRTLILRRTFPELEATHILRAEPETRMLGAEYGRTSRIIRWSNGSITKFSHSADPDEVTTFLSSEWDLISRDELVTFERDQAFQIASSARSTRDDGWRAVCVDGTNPGGPQAAWVKEWYIDKEVDRDEYPDYDPDQYLFVPANLHDNPYLGADYERSLRDLPPMLRKAYLDGSWDIWPGQFFPEFDRARHVREWGGFDPRGRRVFCGVDWGYVAPGVCLWATVTDEGVLYVFDEYTFKMTVCGEVAQEIARRSKAWGVRPTYVADTQMWGGADQTGEDMAETFARFRVPLVQANKDRVNGWARLRHWLRDAPNGQPWLQIHPRCAGLIRTWPQQQSAAHKPEDVDSDSGTDHHVDAMRYLCSARPAPGMVSSARRYPEGTLGAMKQREARLARHGLVGR